jgi:peptidoglycan/LPS O-acetylase OafA/YrhL
MNSIAKNCSPTFISAASRQPAVHWPELDGLRGLAVAFVVVFHYFAEFVSQPTLSAFIQNGQSGVDLFFVLSGFLVGGILLNQRQSKNYFKTFYTRRTFRILPLYFLLLVASLLILSVIGNRFYGTLLPAVSYWLFLQDIWAIRRASFGFLPLSPTWSLAIEEKFYLIAPLLVKKISDRRLAIICTAGLTTIIAIRFAIFSRYSGEIPLPLRVVRGDGLIVGVLIALCHRSAFWGFITKKKQPWWGLMFLLALTLWVPITGAEKLRFTFGTTLISFFYGAFLVITLSHPTGGISTLLRWKALRWLGGISYAVYLMHGPFLWAFYLAAKHLPYYHPPEILIPVVALLVTLGVAQLSGTFFEAPLIKLGKKFKYS